MFYFIQKDKMVQFFSFYMKLYWIIFFFLAFHALVDIYPYKCNKLQLNIIKHMEKPHIYLTRNWMSFQDFMLVHCYKVMHFIYLTTNKKRTRRLIPFIRNLQLKDVPCKSFVTCISWRILINFYIEWQVCDILT